jgi:hypothetical protein
MGFGDFMQRLWEAPAKQQAYEQYGPNFEKIIQDEQERLAMNEVKRKHESTMQPLRVAQAEQSLEVQKQYADQSAINFEQAQTDKRIADKAKAAFGAEQHSVPIGEDGPEMDEETLRIVTETEELRRASQKGEANAEAADLRLRKNQLELEDYEESTEAYPPGEQAKDQRTITQQRIAANEERAKQSTEYDMDERKKAIADHVDDALGINLRDWVNLGEKEQMNNILAEETMSKMGMGDELGKMQAFNQQRQAALPQARMRILGERMEALGAGDWQFTGTDFNKDRMVVWGVIAAMESEQDAKTWPPQIKQAWLQLQSANPQYIDLLTNGLFSQGMQ